MDEKKYETLVSIIGHDWLTPVASIRIKADILLQKRHEMTDEQIDRYLNKIIAAADSHFKLIDETRRSLWENNDDDSG